MLREDQKGELNKMSKKIITPRKTNFRILGYIVKEETVPTNKVLVKEDA